MNEIKKKLFRKLLIGFITGSFIGAGFLLLGGSWEEYLNNPPETIRILVCCGIYGSICIGATILYGIDKVSLLMATLVHYLVVLIGLLLLGISLDWKFNDIRVWSIFVAYTIIFIVNWNIMYLIGKRRAAQMNRDLQRWKSYQIKDKQKK